MADGDGTSGRPHRRVSADKAMEFMLELLENDDGDLSDDSDDSGDDFTILHNNSSDSSSAGEEETSCGGPLRAQIFRKVCFYEQK